MSIAKKTNTSKKEIQPILDFLSNQKTLSNKKYQQKDEVWYSLFHDAYVRIIYDWYKTKKSTYIEKINHKTYTISIETPDFKKNSDSLNERLLAVRKKYNTAENNLINSREKTHHQAIEKMFSAHVETNLIKPLLILKGYGVQGNTEEGLIIQERVSLAEQRRAIRIKNDFRLRIMRKIRLIIGKIQQTFDQARLNIGLLARKTLKAIKHSKNKTRDLIKTIFTSLKKDTIYYSLLFIALVLYTIDLLLFIEIW